MVCLGNICRSPLADGLLRHKVTQRGLEWEVDSAGTANYHVGAPPDARMVDTARTKGFDISALRARQFSKEDFMRFDRIYVMDRSNYRNVIKAASSQEERDKVLFLLEHLFPGKEAEVPDPYYGTSKDFNDVFALVDEATNALLNDLTHEP